MVSLFDPKGPAVLRTLVLSCLETEVRTPETCSCWPVYLYRSLCGNYVGLDACVYGYMEKEQEEYKKGN